MNKMELVRDVMARCGFEKDVAELAVAAVLESITTALADEEKVQILGFGTFEVKRREARMGINPNTKEEIEIPASKHPSFKAGKKLKEAVNQH